MRRTNFATDNYKVKNAKKYVGVKSPTYRSSWELSFMQFCDSNDNILKWASEAIKIPYKNPLTEKQSLYVPDFYIEYKDKFGKIHKELIEIKPANQSLLECVGKNVHNKQEFIKNQAKWKQAKLWCDQHGLTFRVLNSSDMFH